MDLPYPIQARGGGLISNHKGEWIVGFSRYFGIATSVKAELWTLRKGLELAIQHHITLLSLIDQLPGSRLAHIYREENACADLWQSMEEMLDLPSFFCTRRFPIFL